MLQLQKEFWDDSGWIVWGYQTIVNGTTSWSRRPR
jgi:peptide/nickel transport system substrate-binding protein